jgi:hypothetical protein
MCDKMGKKKKTSVSKKAISVDFSIYNILNQFKEDMETRMGGSITFNMVIQSLINDRLDLDNTKSELIKIQKEAQETQLYIRQLLMKAIDRPKSVAIAPSPPPVQHSYLPPPPQYLSSPTQGSPNQQLNSLSNSPPSLLPQASPSPSATQPIKPYQPPRATKNVRNDLITEVKAVFTGEILKPSDVLKMAQPTHAKAEVKSLSDDEIEKREPQHFHAEENQEKFKKSNIEFTNITHKSDEHTEEEIAVLTKQAIGKTEE